MQKHFGKKVAGIILAAGASSRMGRPKQLLDLGGGNLLDSVLKESLCSLLDNVVLVLGYHSKEILKELRTDLNNPRLTVIENRDWKQGISSSIIRGLCEVEGRCEHCMVILADMPYISAGLINDLLEQYLVSGLQLGAIEVGGRRSLPVIFGRPLFKELQVLKGDIGAKDLFVKYSEDTCLVSTDQNCYDLDIDTPEDYQNYLQSSGRMIY